MNGILLTSTKTKRKVPSLGAKADHLVRLRSNTNHQQQQQQPTTSLLNKNRSQHLLINLNQSQQPY